MIDAFAGGIVKHEGETFIVMDCRATDRNPVHHARGYRVLLRPLAWHVSHLPGSPSWRWVPVSELVADANRTRNTK